MKEPAAVVQTLSFPDSHYRLYQRTPSKHTYREAAEFGVEFWFPDPNENDF